MSIYKPSYATVALLAWFVKYSSSLTVISDNQLQCLGDSNPEGLFFVANRKAKTLIQMYLFKLL